MHLLQILRSVILAIVVLTVSVFSALAQNADDDPVQAYVSVCFVPGERCFDKIVAGIKGRAKRYSRPGLWVHFHPRPRCLGGC